MQAWLRGSLALVLWFLLALPAALAGLLFAALWLPGISLLLLVIARRITNTCTWVTGESRILSSRPAMLTNSDASGHRCYAQREGLHRAGGADRGLERIVVAPDRGGPAHLE